PARRYSPSRPSPRLSRIVCPRRFIRRSGVHAVKEFGDVHVPHPLLARLDVTLRCAPRVMGTLTRSKPETTGTEGGVEDGLQHLQKHWLYPPVEHRRNSQQPHASVGFGYFHPPHWTGDIRPGQELFADGFP